MNKRSYYDIIQVASDASQEVISSAYRTIMTRLKKHPDLGGDTEEAVLINEAYETLSDPKLRAEYDRSLENSAPAFSSVIKNEQRNIERRRATRRDVNAVVSFCLGHDQNWHSARVKDLSVLGVRLQSHQSFEVGQHLIIVPSNLASAAIHGTVKWKRMFHPSTFERVYEAGIEFSDQISDIEDRIS
ncbi:MAG: DnaJ domain-containing protein [Deltaproteobacteria bacterium]|jgi:curved DNA-binding protein CbpA|nr:DnaJ domain-containing protein [Deltaproteobacteria bacterium]